MKTKEQMIEDIYEMIADKTLSFGCIVSKFMTRSNSLVKITKDFKFIVLNSHQLLDYEMNTFHEVGNLIGEHIGYKSLGHPVSLSRVLSALGIPYSYERGYIIDYSKHPSKHFYRLCKWKLLNEDGSDAYLDDQSEESIQELHKLLVR